MISKDVILQDEAGLHARPAAQFVKAASGFSSTITITLGEKKANAKSILQVLGLNARKGATITLSAEGADEAEAVARLSELVASDSAGA